MLSKSQAKLFFVTATVGFSGVFLFLTYDTLKQMPERTNADQMTEEVIAGRIIWDENNCMGCHTLYGEGAYYAPELTKVVEDRGEVYIRTFLRDPAAMYPGRRQMVDYDFTEEEIDSLIAFFTWIGNVDLNGFPAETLMEQNNTVSAAGQEALSTAPEAFSGVCQACHAIGGQGGNVGPALDGVATRYAPDELEAWLSDPESIRPGTAMPNPRTVLGMTDAQMAELTTWLLTLE